MIDITLNGGKYRVIFDSEGRLTAHRDGHPSVWRDLTGDNLVFALAQEVERLRAACRGPLPSIEAYSLFRDRAKAGVCNLADLVDWLNYGRTSGYRAARCSDDQEGHWADLLRAQNQEVEALHKAVERLLDGLDSNYEPERCGLSQQQWDQRIKDARAVLEGK